MPELSDLRGIGPATAAVLTEHGLGTVSKLARAGVDALVAVPGFGAARARAVLDAARDAVGPEPAATATRAQEPTVTKAEQDKPEPVKAEKAKSKQDKAKQDKDKKAKGKKAKAKKAKGNKAKAKKAEAKKAEAKAAARASGTAATPAKGATARAREKVAKGKKKNKKG